MSAHTMTINFAGAFPSYRVNCKAPPDSLCRAEWPCDCEVFAESGVDADGPWHKAYAWGEPGLPSVFHRGTFGTGCNWVAMLTDDGGLEQYGSGEVTLGIELYWDEDVPAWKLSREDGS